MTSPGVGGSAGYDWRKDPRSMSALDKSASSIPTLDPTALGLGIGVAEAVGAKAFATSIGTGVSGGVSDSVSEGAGTQETDEEDDALPGIGEGKLSAKYLGVSNPYGGTYWAPEPNTQVYGEMSPGYVPPGQIAGPGATGDLNIDSIMYGIKMHESGGSYTAKNPLSSASGAYQYIDSTWAGYGGYSQAWMAPPEVQDARMRADTIAAYNRYGNWDQTIAAHFGGAGYANSGNFSSVPGSPGYNNPTGQAYLDSVYEFAGGSPANSTAGPTYSGGQMSDAINTAMTMLGTPYVWGGEDASGVDCSGLIYYAYNSAGIDMPRYRAIDYGRMGTAVSLDQAMPGDIVYTDNPNTDTDHVGIYLGDGKMIVAPTTGQLVKIDEVGNYTSIRRVADSSAYAGMSTNGMGSTQVTAAGQTFSTMPNPQLAPQPFIYKRPNFSEGALFGTSLFPI